jgi:hypothetical protein
MSNLRFTLIVLILVGIIVAAVLILPGRPRNPITNTNSLNIGAGAPIAKLDILLRDPMELDFMTKEEVLQLRKDAVSWYPDLLAGEYQPADSIFGQIVDGLPWWGIEGQYYFGQGEKSIEGPSEESRFILNPFLLIAVEPNLFWDRMQISESQIRQHGFRLYCEPTRLRWKPQESYAEVMYSADCAARLGYRYFDLISYNARDFNLNYIYVSYPDSLHVDKNPRPAEPYAIPHYIHSGGSCGYPGDCNNMSPASPPIDALELTGLPAQIVIWLWNERPDSLDQPADMVFVIQFQ